jgi:hypothetical protein
MGKTFSREFSSREKVLLLILALIIVGSVYYLLVFQPVSEGLKSAKAEKQSIEELLILADAQATQIGNMQQEMESIKNQGLAASFMPSYNAERKELEFLHEVLSADTQEYIISFSQVEREGNQIRRNFNLSFTVANYKVAKEIITQLEDGAVRCLIGDMAVGANGEEDSILAGEVQVNCVATFYETMYEGVEDADLPKDSAEGSDTYSEEADY